MRQFAVIAAGWLLTLGFTFAGEPTFADKKWLVAVEKMVAEGRTQVSTPLQQRVRLLQDWAGKNGYSIKVTRSEANYRAQITKRFAQN